MPDPTARLRFDGDESRLKRSLGKVGNEMSQTAKGIQRDAGKAENALQGIQSAADKIKVKPIDIRADTGKAESQIAAVGDSTGPVNIAVKADTGKAQKDIQGLKGEPVEVPVKADTGAAERKIKQMGQDAGGAAGQAGGSAFGSKFLGVLGGVGFASTLTGIASDAFAAASEKSKVKASLQNQMGITPDEARKYGDRVGSAYAGGLGDSKDQIAGVYSTLSSDVADWAKRTESAQDSVAKRQVKVVQGLGIDTVAAIGAASAAVTNKLVPSFEDAQDLVVTGFQTLGSRGDDWADTLKEYSGYFKNLGFDGATALGTIRQMMAAGARDTDYAADAFKEFNIRIIDGGELTKQALKDLGKEFKNVPQEIAKGGPTALAALDKVIDKIKTIKDPIKQNEIGVALFGTQWEDTMKQVVSSVDISTAAIGGKFQGAVDKMAVATDTNVDRFQRRWENGLSIVGEKLATWANDGASAIDGLANGMQQSLKKVGDQHPFKGITEAMEKLNKMTVEVKVQAEWQKVQDIHNRLKGLPPKTPIVVDAVTGPARADLERLGYQVKTLPGGKIEVTANTNPAKQQAEATMRWLNSLYANITVGVVGPGKNYALKNMKGGMAALAEGGWVSGPGTGTSDSVPLWGSDGEFMTKEKEAQKPYNRQMLEAINSGKDWRQMVNQQSGAVPVAVPSGGGSRGPSTAAVVFGGNLDTMFATYFQRAVRNGMIQIKVTS